MTFPFRTCLLLSVLALWGSSALLGAPPGTPAAGEMTRTFAAQKCRYTLPGPDWVWTTNPALNVLFAAENKKTRSGIVFTAMNSQAPRLDDSFIKGFETTFFQPGRVTKRGGQSGTFKGVASYQATALRFDGASIATRLFIAHGVLYNLMNISPSGPVGDQDFEAIMQGFEFTVPPPQETRPMEAGTPGIPQASPRAIGPAVPSNGATAPDNAYERGRAFGTGLGMCFGTVVVVALVVWLIVRSNATKRPVKRKRRKKRIERDEEDDE